MRGQAPAELRNAGEAKWARWAKREDKAIRARLHQGDLDSVVNLLLFGTSFTSQPRVLVESITEASKSGVLRARVDDLVAALRSPGDNERVLFLLQLMQGQGVDPTTPGGAGEAGKFLYDNLLRVLQERKVLAERAAEASAPARPNDPTALLDRSSFFRDRGLSLDTSILPDFEIETALRDLQKRGLLRAGQVARVAVIGPGLDFIDKNEESAFDYHPQQTSQPFALYDSLVRLKLAKDNAVSVSVLDISARVIDHLRRARDGAVKKNGYVLQLPRDVARPWPPELLAYWKSFGDGIGAEVTPMRPPEIFPGLETRAVEIRPDVVLSCEPVDLDIVLEHLDLLAGERFDLMVATNLFVYYSAFEQALALENVGAMLRPGGLLLTNDRLPEVAGGSMHLAGVTVVAYETGGVSVRQPVGWYQKRALRP